MDWTIGKKVGKRMTISEVAIVALGGFVGAILRYVISNKLNASGRFPVGTLAVNLIGSLCIGILFGLDIGRLWNIFIVSGFLGALTTYSTLQKELLTMSADRMKKRAVLYGVITYGGGIILAYCGYMLSS